VRGKTRGVERRRPRRQAGGGRGPETRWVSCRRRCRLESTGPLVIRCSLGLPCRSESARPTRFALLPLASPLHSESLHSHCFPSPSWFVGPSSAASEGEPRFAPVRPCPLMPPASRLMRMPRKGVGGEEGWRGGGSNDQLPVPPVEERLPLLKADLLPHLLGVGHVVVGGVRVPVERREGDGRRAGKGGTKRG
jgi:hypothetical protein